MTAHLRSLHADARLLGWGRREHDDPALDEYSIVDLCDYDLVSRACNQLADLDYVIHLAGAMPPRPVDELWRSNVEGTMSLLLGLVSAGLSDFRFLNVGSAAEYFPLPENRALEEGDNCGSVNAYGRSKWAQEIAAFAVAERYGLDVVATRTFNLLGPGLPKSFVAGAIVEQLSGMSEDTPENVKIGKGDAERDFVDVRDAVVAYERLMRLGQSGQVYNVCSGIPVRIDALAQELIAASGVATELETGRTATKHNEGDRVFGSPSLTKTETDWSPSLSLRKSLKDMIGHGRWLRPTTSA